LAAVGYPAPHVVTAQAHPDPDFPTVPFPNPEEPGAMDLVLELARSVDADLALANDPDGDRLAVAVPDPVAPAGWRVLTGDQVGALLGAYVLERTAAGPDAADRLVATTIVSSSLLSKVAAAAGARYAETLTGFKWIVRAADAHPGSRFVFGYEEALGYSVGTVVRDKDGLGAALAFLGLTVAAREQGSSPLDLLDELERRHGVHLTSQLSIRTDSAEVAMTRLRRLAPAHIGGRAVMAVEDLAGGSGRDGLPPADVLTYRLDGARLVVRPSGTEPKLKVYFEVVRPVHPGGLAATRGEAAAEMAHLRDAAAALIGA
jgi:phosphomannomutase